MFSGGFVTVFLHQQIATAQTDDDSKYSPKMQKEMAERRRRQTIKRIRSEMAERRRKEVTAGGGGTKRKRFDSWKERDFRYPPVMIQPAMPRCKTLEECRQELYTTKNQLIQKSSNLNVCERRLLANNNINTSCTQDADCVLVSKGCCSCNNGGTYLAIHKSEKSSYESKLQKRCSVPQNCSAWYRCGEWLDKAQCINSKCSVVYKKEQQHSGYSNMLSDEDSGSTQ